ncbi:uncharacterized protein LOC107405565 [Ziziphus jujuba]|uniref:Uncharacterized protein LOC107405565 n=2 Tax=Ziziphus jujuba TaxID=326968 RepID=A0A6P4BJ12_ZIZJJ|nr:uncharacterized protein LOC107405565 [Ziziphus jujuba]KAH7512574.1 hypothetical protein FEM48_Zijuj12G0105000 [Ziziphus jujuba var. spinosa]
MKAIKKTLPHYYSPPPIKFSRICFSSAYERAEGSNAVGVAREGKNGGGTSGLSYTPKETVKEGLYEAKQQGLDMTNDAAARDGPTKPAEMADNVKETAKKTMDGAWKAARDTTKNIKEAIIGESDENEGPNKGNVQDSGVEDLRRRAGGYDLGDH